MLLTIPNLNDSPRIEEYKENMPSLNHSQVMCVFKYL
jgi:hypothetical protein